MSRLIVAADVSTVAAAEDLARQLAGTVGMVKVGLELYAAEGPESVRRLRGHLPVFLDLKLHDIPTTVERASRVVGSLGAAMITVHALGGPDMVAAAARGSSEGAVERGLEPPEVIAVTVLSSLAEAAGASPASLAFEAIEAGARGVVCSGDHVREVREALGEGPLIVVPGIRPTGLGPNDHARVLTPGEAVERGADLLVVGRPITRAADPAAAARAITRELEG
ncbi:MAG TPA: orotidine-5'-phosphate decarboxylase [Actinomycetota bacterium]|nr:orotidine-5'-phosphate decarboxylase [Actinomycetota bacterium]